VYYAAATSSGGTKGYPGGVCPNVGIGGHLPGGGIGYLTRMYGFACDHILALKMVGAFMLPVDKLLQRNVMAGRSNLDHGSRCARPSWNGLKGGCTQPRLAVSKAKRCSWLLLAQVAASGELVVADDTQNQDLLWAACGSGGGSLGKWEA